MKLTQDIIRQLIKEEISRGLTEVTDQELAQNAITQISNLLVRLEAEGLNAQDILNRAKRAYDASEEASDSLGERKLTPAEEEKREEIAKAMEEEDPDIDMSKKMAIATAQAKKSA
jgi:hypothetical protein